MRKDIFIVGARLLGIWQLLGAVSSFVWLLTGWLGIGYLRTQQTSQEYNSIHFIVQIVTGLYLLLRTHNFFHFLERLKEDDQEARADENDSNHPA